MKSQGTLATMQADDRGVRLSARQSHQRGAPEATPRKELDRMKGIALPVVGSL